MTLISDMSPEQEKQVPVWRKRWFEIGTRTGPAKKKAAVSAAMILREALGVTKKPIVIWANSPLQALQILGVLNRAEATSLEDLKRKAAMAKPEMSFLGQALWGQVEAFWICFYTFCRDILGIRYVEKQNKLLNAWADLAHSTFWWWCFENYIVFSERPTEIHLVPPPEGGTERLHNTAGPAVAFKDGTKYWYVEGVRVPSKIVEAPEKLTAGDVRSETNQEVRRIMLQRMGLEKFLKESGSEIIHSEEDPPRRLHRTAQFPGEPEPHVYVEVQDPSTERMYFLRVPPTVTTCTEAVAWTFGLTAEQYKPEVET